MNCGFLKNEDSKKELFSFISREMSATDMDGRLLLTTFSGDVLSSKPCDVTTLQPCNHAAIWYMLQNKVIHQLMFEQWIVIL